ncbi:MAG: hypothetical protein J6Q42_03335 [Clostridia bacterium]|jgi:hypothetical protein|nr:hypothetical protein [Clostridia bacterium]
MITILPADKEKTTALAQKEAVSLPISAMIMTDGTNELGYVLYRVEKDVLEIIKLYSCDTFLEEGLVRAALNDGVNRQTVTAVCQNTALFFLLESLGFSFKNNEMNIFIPDFFNRPCNH